MHKILRKGVNSMFTWGGANNTIVCFNKEIEFR